MTEKNGNNRISHCLPKILGHSAASASDLLSCATTSVLACLVRIDLFFDTTGGLLQRKEVDKKESIPSPLLLQAHGVAAKMRHKNGRILLPVSLHAKNSDHFHCRKDRIEATRHLWKYILYYYYTSYKHIHKNEIMLWKKALWPLNWRTKDVGTCPHLVHWYCANQATTDLVTSPAGAHQSEFCHTFAKQFTLCAASVACSSMFYNTEFLALTVQLSMELILKPLRP